MTTNELGTQFSADFFSSEGRSYVTLRIPLEDGLVQTKIVTYEAFLDSLKDSTSNETTRVGPLPSGVYDLSVSEKFTDIVYEAVPGKRSLLYSRAKEGQKSNFYVPYPRLIFKARLEKDETVRHMEVCAIKSTDELSDETPIYRYPYCNVYNYGNVCMGGNVIREAGDIRQTKEMSEFFFFNSPSNGDLFDAQISHGKSFYDFLVMVEKYADFPDELLVPTGRTLGDFCKKS